LSLVERSPTVAAFTVAEFCAAHRICRTRLYALWSAGQGPRYMKNGVRRLISVEAATDWRRDMEKAAAESSAPV